MINLPGFSPTIFDSTTKLYCVLGNPVSHSKSPLVHNLAFQMHEMNSVYLAFSPLDIESGVSAIRTLSICGASITLPFKESIIPFLDKVDESAIRIGAVNTIINKDGILYGYNTDFMAMLKILQPFGIAGKKVLVIGAGGAAKAAAFGVVSEKGQLFIANRTTQRGQALAMLTGGHFVGQDQLIDLKADIIINTTSVGMEPHQNFISFPEHGLSQGMVVMDMVYTPVDTCLIKAARKTGCHVVDGLSIFVVQAAAQFLLWTDIMPDINVMRSAVLKEKS